MPIYEFECERCGVRFDSLVNAGTGSVACEECGAEQTRRRYSAQAAPLELVKGPGERRRQEARNAELQRRTKTEFKERRGRARERRGKAGGGDDG